jgi:hypothetical protein
MRPMGPQCASSATIRSLWCSLFSGSHAFGSLFDCPNSVVVSRRRHFVAREIVATARRLGCWPVRGRKTPSGACFPAKTPVETQQQQQPPQPPQHRQKRRYNSLTPNVHCDKGLEIGHDDDGAREIFGHGHQPRPRVGTTTAVLSITFVGTQSTNPD